MRAIKSGLGQRYNIYSFEDTGQTRFHAKVVVCK